MTDLALQVSASLKRARLVRVGWMVVIGCRFRMTAGELKDRANTGTLEIVNSQATTRAETHW
jgi:hypothetical protein